MEHDHTVEQCLAKARICGDCKQLKLGCEYDRHNSRLCKNPCRSAQARTARRKRLALPGEREKYNAYMRERTAGMTDEQLLARQLKVYKITIEDWNNFLKEQDGKCAICLVVLNTDYGNNNRQIHVDHCHSSGRVRGLLCSNCNLMLGQAKDDPARLMRAALYLQERGGE